MVIAQLADVNHYGNSILNPVLQVPQFGPVSSSPQAGQFYTNADGVLCFRTQANVELPVHENSVLTVAGVGAITAAQSGRSVVVSVADASATNKGVISATLFGLLNGATASDTPNTLVLRDDTGGFSAGTISVSNLTGLSTVPPTDDSAVSLACLNNAITQVQQSVAGRDFKEAVAVALTTNLALSSTAGTYDGVALAVGDSLALLNQTDPIQNGIYQITATGLIRRSDANSEAQLHSGAVFPVAEGTLQGRLIMQQSPPGYIMGTDPINLVALDDSVLPGDGMGKSGHVLNAIGTPGRISVNSAIDIDSTYVGQASITTLGTITTGTWNGTAVALANGGTGATTADQALTNLGGPQEYAPVILGDGTATSFTVTGTWNNPYPDIRLFYEGKALSVEAVEITIVDNNSFTLVAKKGSNPISTGSLVVIVGGKKL